LRGGERADASDRRRVEEGSNGGEKKLASELEKKKNITNKPHLAEIWPHGACLSVVVRRIYSSLHPVAFARALLSTTLSPSTCSLCTHPTAHSTSVLSPTIFAPAAAMVEKLYVTYNDVG
jgi:hypothetical protein